MRIQRKRGQDAGEGSGDKAVKPGGRTRTASIDRKPRSHGSDAVSGPAADVVRRSGPDGDLQRAPAWAGEAAHESYEAMAGISPSLGAMIQRAAQGEGTTIDDVATAVVENRGTGKALDGEVRRQVEPHLGADLSGVRVHTDKDAAAASSAIGARAFAYRSDVFLGADESPSDVKLMAHELTHPEHRPLGRRRGAGELHDQLRLRLV